MRITRLQIYVVTIALIGLIILLGVPFTPIVDLQALIIFCALVAAAEWMSSTLLAGQIILSIASAVSFTASLIFAPTHAGLVGAIGGATAGAITARRQKFNRRRTLRNLAFNTGMNALATFIGAIIFQTLRGGPLVQSVGPADLPALLLAALVNDQVNALALVIMIAIQSGQKPFTIWRENFAWAAPINVITMAIGGGALATGFRAIGLTGLLVFFLPVFLSAYAFRAYVTRTQAVMAHLEETVQARTADLAKANESLRALNAQKDAFFAVITHDMRTPLTSMLGFTELLARASSLNDEGTRFLEGIRRNTDSLMGMVNNILDLAKLDSGGMEYQRAPLNLSHIVNDVLLSIAGHARTRGIDLENQVEATPDLIGDEEKLRRVVANLVANALKYTREGSQVVVGLRQLEGQLQLVVSDTGIGIPADQLPYIFERFRRVRRSSGTDMVGTGLGLAIVQEFVHAHGGRVEVVSQEHVGSTFTVTLPLAPLPEPVK